MGYSYEFLMSTEFEKSNVSKAKGLKRFFHVKIEYCETFSPCRLLVKHKILRKQLKNVVRTYPSLTYNKLFTSFCFYLWHPVVASRVGQHSSPHIGTSVYLQVSVFENCTLKSHLLTSSLQHCQIRRNNWGH